MEKRKPRKKLAKEKEFKNPLKPFDFSKIGTENDPCFGKHYDVKTPECQACGDSELCLVAMSQNLAVKRKNLEGKSTFKDIEQDIEPTKDEIVQVPKLVNRYIKKEYTLKKTLRLILKKYPEVDQSWVKRLYKNKTDEKP
jgi:hypothetical protein